MCRQSSVENVSTRREARLVPQSRHDEWQPANHRSIRAICLTANQQDHQHITITAVHDIEVSGFQEGTEQYTNLLPGM